MLIIAAIFLGLALLILIIIGQKFTQLPIKIPGQERVIEPARFQPTTGPPQPTSREKLTGLQVAEKISQFLDKTIEDDGLFQLFYRCDKKIAEGCIRAEPDKTPHSGMIVMAYWDLYQKTENLAYRQKADRAMSAILKKCQQDDNFCEWNFFPFFTYFQQTKDEKYKDALLQVADRFFTNQSLDKHVHENHGIKLQILYQVTGDSKYRDKLVKMTDAILKGELDNLKKNNVIYQEGGLTIRKWSQNFAWNNFIPAYKATNDDKYLKATQALFDQGQFAKHFDDFVKADDYFSLLLALDNLLNLVDFTLTKDTYLSQAREIAQKSLDLLWDSPKRRLFNGDFAMLGHFSKIPNQKSTLNNGWMARLFLKMEGQTFEY